MSFTELHRALGVASGPLTDELLNDAVAAGVVETDGDAADEYKSTDGHGPPPGPTRPVTPGPL
jgi:hypothetical protein